MLHLKIFHRDKIMALETLVKKHYGRRANFTEELLERARTTAKNPGTLTVDDMGAYDEFHIGGRAATEYLSERMMFEKGASCLDVGCGIGGPARYMAKHYDVDVTGIDLTPEFIVMAKELSSALGDSGNTKFDAGSALDMPYADGSFDCATQFHVGMNIEDKKTLCYRYHLKPS
jgi:cyclopropane fatty-acyl-phospholipid synthase-like methyltransferase